MKALQLIVTTFVNIGILHPWSAFGFTASPQSLAIMTPPQRSCQVSFRVSVPSSKQSRSCLCAHETEIAGYTIAFATSHIGMSAIRRDLIDRIGSFAGNIGWVGTGAKLPDFWPGDDYGGQEIFPSQEIAGRQLYRILYTIVSFTTLGMGFGAYLQSLSEDAATFPTLDEVSLWYTLASLSGGISIASLVNPSPLSLVPVYEQSSDEGEISSANSSTQPSSITGIRRNDSKKLNAYGLTRITRHPLILPVVPWGVATAMIMGGQFHDFLLFGILSVYAIAGCAAQDLRVLNEEGSVGTVFNPGASLQDFFQETSFLPFGAILDSRQSWEQAAREIKWWAIVAGIPIAFKIEEAFVAFLQSFAEAPLS